MAKKYNFTIFIEKCVYTDLAEKCIFVVMIEKCDFLVLREKCNLVGISVFAGLTEKMRVILMENYGFNILEGNVVLQFKKI